MTSPKDNLTKRQEEGFTGKLHQLGPAQPQLVLFFSKIILIFTLLIMDKNKLGLSWAKLRKNWLARQANVVIFLVFH